MGKYDMPHQCNLAAPVTSCHMEYLQQPKQ